MKRLSFIFGTRPEAIKLYPVILAARRYGDLETHVCATGQHRHMLDQVLTAFGIAPDVDLGLMQQDQTLAALTARAVTAIDGYLAQHQPDLVLVQGDTTTTFCATLASFYRHIPVAHVEAGLRTWNKASPFPEEVNRVLVSHVAELHFAPTAWAKSNLLREGVPEHRIFVTGNTVIDALRLVAERARRQTPDIPGLPAELLDGARPASIVLITGHRRENFGAGFRSICQAIADLASRFRDTAFVYPVHLNPNVRQPVFDMLSQHDNVYLLEPLSYLAFVALMDRSRIILTDSGGVQEEAPSLGKPVLVMRDTTERPEVVEAGLARLVGCAREAIVEGVSDLLTDERAYHAMAGGANP
jgi:UDP-N-acetylglucosamine 2-epimerase